MRNPFAVLGVPEQMELDPDELEERYLRLSRESHPDFHRGGGEAERLAVLARSAEVNDAWRTLRDPWRRAEALIGLRDPQAMAKTKTLCPIFLSEAMEMREAVTEAAPKDFARLEHDLDAKVAQYFHDVARMLDAGEIRQAATLLHQSNYYRKARAELLHRAESA